YGNSSSLVGILCVSLSACPNSNKFPANIYCFSHNKSSSSFFCCTVKCSGKGFSFPSPGTSLSLSSLISTSISSSVISLLFHASSLYFCIKSLMSIICSSSDSIKNAFCLMTSCSSYSSLPGIVYVSISVNVCISYHFSCPPCLILIDSFTGHTSAFIFTNQSFPNITL